MALLDGVVSGAVSGATPTSTGSVGTGAVSGARSAYDGTYANKLSQSILEKAFPGGRKADGTFPTQNDINNAYASAGLQDMVKAYNSSFQGGEGGGTVGSEFAIAGLSDQWLSPDQLRAKTNALGSGLLSGGSSSGGGGGGGGSSGGGTSGSGSAGSGVSLGAIGGATTSGSNPGSLTQGTTQIGSTVGYQNPAVGYGAVGGAGGGQGQAGVLQMQPANGQNALNQYKSTAGYQNLNAPGAYQQSPGYQYAMDQAMGQVQQQAAGKGMLESGAVIKQMQQTASGLAQQDYGNWWNRQNQLYSDYQNRLQGLAGGPTGAADAMTAGANAAQANLQTGSNLGSLFGNQGTSGMGGIINTAAAQSGNMINAGQQQATVDSANQATRLAGATVGGNSGGLF